MWGIDAIQTALQISGTCDKSSKNGEGKDGGTKQRFHGEGSCLILGFGGCLAALVERS